MSMNRRIALVSALAAVGFLSACGSGSDSPTTSISVTPALELTLAEMFMRPVNVTGVDRQPELEGPLPTRLIVPVPELAVKPLGM